MKKIISQISKKLLAALLILWASVTVSAQDKSVVVISKDGSTHTVALGKVDRLDFGQSAMSVRRFLLQTGLMSAVLRKALKYVFLI